MSESRRFPFGSVPIYNPQSLSKDEALAQFHARQAAYESLMSLLHEERPSHVLIIGTRGMGKTTLLQRVHYGVEDDAELSSRYVVLAFPEEQYNVNRLHRFMLNAVDALADAMERLHEERLVAQIESFAGTIGKLGPDEIEERVPQFLTEIGRQTGRSFLLLVDNADRLFETIEGREQWKLRELLSSQNDLTLFGATTQASDGIYGSDRAFFEFFKIYTLAPLTFTEVRDLLIQLSISVEEQEGEKGSVKRRVEEWLAADPARLHTLVQLTGGNPRTTVLLFHLVLDGLAGGAREYLEQLLDQCTPNYKGRVDELPAQAQQVLDAVALRWDPVTAMEVADDTGLETNVVSTQLTRLVRQGVLEKADPGDSKKALYQVAERFFNIWYLMRASRRVRAKLRWFVEFLRVFFDSSELEKIAWERLQRFRGAEREHLDELEDAFAYVLASGADRRRIEEYLRRECAGLETEWGPYVESIRSVEDGVASVGIGGASKTTSITDEEALRRAVEAEPRNADNWFFLGHLLASRPESTSEAEVAFQKAIELNPRHRLAHLRLGLLQWLSRPERNNEAELSLRTAIEINPLLPIAWTTLGGFLAAIPDRRDEAESTLRKAIELDPKSTSALTALGMVFGMQGRTSEAEDVYRKAVEMDPMVASSWEGLGDVLAKLPGRKAEAETAYRKAIELKPTAADFWDRLGGVLSDIPERKDEAEAAYRKAIEIDPLADVAWDHLGDLLSEVPERMDEAEAAYRKAVQLNPQNFTYWADLSRFLLQRDEGWLEAEGPLRKAIELEPKHASLWSALGSILSLNPSRTAEAEAALRKGIELDPESASLWRSLGYVLACQVRKPEDAEKAFREAIRLEPEYPSTLRNLGVLLFCELSREHEAVDYLQRAAQLQPEDPVSAAIVAACIENRADIEERLPFVIEESERADFWNTLLDLCENYSPFGKILLRICDLVQEQRGSNRFGHIHRAVALAQLGDFPRASVALEDALIGDPIEQLSFGRKALDVFLAAAVRRGRVRDCIELLDRKEWKDAWRPIYEALEAVEAGSAEYLKRVAVEIREPALVILRRIAPELSGLTRAEV